VGPSEHARARQALLSHFGPVVDGTDPDRAAAELRGHDACAIVTFSERVLRLTTRLARLLDLPYHDDEITRLLSDKSAQRRALREAGVDAVGFHRIASMSDWAVALARVGLPAVLKPVHGGGSRNTFLIEDGAAGEALVARLLAEGGAGFPGEDDLVVEEYLRGRPSAPFGDFVSVESAVVSGDVRHFAVMGKFPLAVPFRETGEFWPSHLSDAEEKDIENLARQAIGALRIRSGIVHTEIKLTEKGPRIIEVNGRLGGDVHTLLRSAAKFSPIELAGQIALGRSIQAPGPSCDRVFFQLNHPAPRRRCQLVAVHGIDEVRSLPGVATYRAYARAGSSLSGGVHTSMLDQVAGHARDHDELARLIPEISRRLRFQLLFDGEPSARLVTGAELHAL
jgi:biotin carboxylase